jgi:hypothetical protein
VRTQLFFARDGQGSLECVNVGATDAALRIVRSADVIGLEKLDRTSGLSQARTLLLPHDAAERRT